MRRPTPTRTSQAFWDAANAGRLSYPRCPACGTWHGYPRPYCTQCLHEPLELVPVSGRGTVYAATAVHRPVQPSFAVLVPYSYALVDLEEGIRVVTMIVGCPPEAVSPGLSVEATIDAPAEDDQPATPLVFYTPTQVHP